MHEQERLQALLRYGILDTPPEQAYDDIASLAAFVAETPIAMISLVDRDRVWFKSTRGITRSEMPRDVSFCSHAILNPKRPLLLPDATLDDRFADNPLVTGEPGIRFYCGAALVTYDLFALGTLCVLDYRPRVLGPDQVQALAALSRQVVKLLELRRTTEAAQAANRAKSVFLANMSHDIRTPVASVLGMADLLLETPLAADQAEQVETIKVAADGLLTLINDILDLSKVEAGRLELDLRELSVRELAVQVARMLSFSASRKGLELELQVDSAVPAAVSLDGPRLRQVLVNLVGNAVKFTGAGKVSLTVSAAPRGAWTDLTFAVTDSGPGIPASRREVVFEAFAQADRAITRKYGGTGLGLAISRRLVEAMGGILTLTSEEGVGSTFSFTIPAQIAAAQSAADAAEPIDMPPQASLSILMAEDNPVLQKVLSTMLARQGHTVEVATDGRVAAEAYERNEFDVVLMDVEMPGMNGWEATAAIRAIETRRGARVPIVAMTAHAMVGDEARCLDAGMDAYLAKPIRPADLFAVIGRLAARPQSAPRRKRRA